MSQGIKTPAEKAGSIVLLHRQGVPHAEIARRLRIGTSTLYRVLHASGETVGTFDRSDPENDRRITELYPHHSQQEIADLLGVKKNLVARAARRLGLAHTPETEKRLRDKEQAARQAANTPEVRARAQAKMRRVRRMEMRRLLGGEAPRTGYRLLITPRKLAACLWRLKRVYGYIYVRNSYTLYYDDGTRRLEKPCAEEWYAHKYGITFQPLPPTLNP